MACPILPSRDYLRKLLAQHGWHPRQCILVEDSANLQQRRRLGMRTVMITAMDNTSRRKVVLASADITVKSVFQLARL